MSMFRSPAAEPIPVDAAGDPLTAELISLVELALTLDAPTTGGWGASLAAVGIEVVQDDVGRDAIRRSDARRLILERRQAEAQQAAERERQAVEADQLRFAQMFEGVPADSIPVGVSAGEAMLRRRLRTILSGRGVDRLCRRYSTIRAR